MSDTETVPSFAEMPLAPAVIKAVQDVGYETPSPIQAQSIPHLLEGRDLLGLAQTGTGKTAAFALPLLSRVDVKKRHPQILVLAPTRELAIQVAEAFQRYARHMPGFHVLPVYGGQDMRGQLRGLQRGAQVIVGTPGRVMDHLRRGSMKLDDLKAVVLDEADEMLRMGFVDDIEWIMEQTPSERQVALFSATMPRQIRKIADTHLTDPVTVEIKSKTATVDTITQKVCMVSGYHKLDALTRILEVEPFDAMIIFVRTKTATVELAEKLEARGFSAAALNGDMSQALREKVIDRLKKSSLDILIATDVAARGLDVERMSHVVNYDIPYDTEAYVHRIGRTGRAGRQGTAILFATHRERRMLRAIENATRQRIDDMRLPSMRDVRDMRIRQFKEDVTKSLELGDEKLADFRNIVNELMTEGDMSPEDLAAALCFMAQKERPFPDGKEPERQQRQRRERDDRRGDRGERGDRGDRPRRDRREDNEGMVRYRVEVGREQGINPGDLVGAIANESKIPGKNIGHIRLFERCSSIYLPEGMDDSTLSSLKQVKVRNKPLEMSVWVDDGTLREERPRRRRRDGEFRRDRDRRSNSSKSNASRRPRHREEHS
ncbi:RNA helicase [Endozoicomonas montiporae]|uniref:ATP-dependent RNA helicase DeaD n=2 Tax=Endozoicomonas montiporae TaxID=1027273 RepID=A0A081N2Y0_9GAMM|nr:DEAD/DEAH box helicase [Endozoicomonas montiporae]AMO58071.1 cold-shock DEAD-box protein A [Endozoicomonas montiporae CL-33]KEQ12803.1 RNA helicase [Endozoicomonas montiporae]